MKQLEFNPKYIGSSSSDEPWSDIDHLIPISGDSEYILRIGDHISVSTIKHQDVIKCLQDFVSLHNQKQKTDLPIYKKQL